MMKRFLVWLDDRWFQFVCGGRGHWDLDRQIHDGRAYLVCGMCRKAFRE